jgi:cytochrome c5
VETTSSVVNAAASPLPRILSHYVVKLNILVSKSELLDNVCLQSQEQTSHSAQGGGGTVHCNSCEMCHQENERKHSL